jgi:hypothetical protein
MRVEQQLAALQATAIFVIAGTDTNPASPYEGLNKHSAGRTIDKMDWRGRGNAGIGWPLTARQHH